MLEGRVWERATAATPAMLDHLRAVAGFDLPADYLALLGWSNGGEGPLPCQPLWLVLDAAATVVAAAEAGDYAEFFPGLFVIGGNGGGEAIALDGRTAPPHPVVAFDMTNADLSESIRRLAPDFSAFLAMIGRPSPEIRS